MSAAAQIVVDLDAIRANARTLAALVAPAKLTLVLKAEAYGHGLAAVARAVAPLAARICVYTIAEAEAVREAGVTIPVHVLGPIEPRDLARAHTANAAITLWDDGAYRDDVRRAARGAGAPIQAHAKIDTGVVRLGMRPEDAPARIASYLDDPALDVCGVFSHLAAVEELDLGFTGEQCARFDAALAPLADRLRERAIDRHIAASAAAMLYPQTRYDAVRCGIALYGIYPSPSSGALLRERGVHLAPALAWTTQLVVVHDVDVGTSVGYGRAWTADGPRRIGVLPIGYAEGLPRAASNSAHVLIRGIACPVVGRVCMDMTMVDVTAVPDARPGTSVVLIGRDGAAVQTADDWGGWCDTISYEIVARLPSATPRTYRGEAT